MLSEMLQRSAQNHPRKPAILQGGRHVSYGQLNALAGSCAGGLKHLKVGLGDCVAFMLPNSPEFVAGLFACAQLGAVMLPLNPQFTRKELRRIVEDARPAVVVADPSEHAWVADLGIPAAAFETLEQESTVAAPAGTVNCPVLYLYTSGSTDTYKRLCCTQENLYFEAHNFVETVGLTSQDNILCTIPLCHSYGLGNCLLDTVYCGSTLVLPESDDSPFAAQCRRVIELVQRYDVRFYPGVPYQFHILATYADGGSGDLAGLKLCVSSGDVLPRQTYDRFLERFGVPIRSLYGSTEAGSIAINLDGRETRDEERGARDGPHLSPFAALRNVTLEIRDAEGTKLPVGADGDIWVKSPTIPPTGYDNRADLTRATFRDGFYKTGDIGRLNQRGHLILAGRKQGFIDIAGYKVDTAEVEEVLQSCPGVREAAVLGVEVPRLGTLMKAALVTDGPCRSAEIREFCRQRLAFYKVPRLIEAYPSLPRNTMGKVLKSELGGADSYLAGIRNEEANRIIGRLATMPLGKRKSQVASLVQVQVAAVLGWLTTTVPRNVGFVELGMDSFGAIELLTRLEYLFDQEFPQTFAFDHPTVDAITENLLGLFERVGLPQ